MDARMYAGVSVRRLQYLFLGLLFSIFTAKFAQAAPVVVSVDHRVIVSYSKPQFDARKGIFTVQARIKNRSDAALLSPLQLSFDQAALKNLRIQNAQGIGKDGRPYFDIKLPKGLLLAKASSDAIKVVIAVERKEKDVKPGNIKTVLAVLNRAQHVSAGVEVAPLEPRAEPYALKVDSGKVNVRFSVRVVGQSKLASSVNLRRVGDRKIIAMNDMGKAGDQIARDGIYGIIVPIDTFGMKAGTCLGYEVITRAARAELTSPLLQVCISSFPVRIAKSNKSKTLEFPDGLRAVADEILVRFAPNTGEATIRNILAEINAVVVGSLIPANLYQARMGVPVSRDRMLEIIAKLKAHPEITKAYPNVLGGPASIPNDPEFSNQHGVQRVKANDVWDLGGMGNGIIVAVLDTGIDRSHPDFGTVGDCQLVDNDCGLSSTDFDNVNGHGTAVAGVIAAKTNNSQGVAGGAPSSKIKSILVGADTSYSLAEIRQAFLDASSYGAASVINASLTIGPLLPFDFAPPTLDVGDLCAAVNSAVYNGVTPVAIVVNAVGNNGSNGNYYPGRCNDSAHVLHDQLPPSNKKYLITVANSISTLPIDPVCANANALDQRCGGTTTNVLNTSNYGAWVDIAAPGMKIRTTRATAIGGGYFDYTGTSFAAPMVSSAVAILKSCGVPFDQIEDSLKMLTNPVGKENVGFPDGSSAPRLDISLALQSLNHSPTGISFILNSINENTPTPTPLEAATLTATDTDTCDKYTYTIVGGPDAGSLNIVGNKLNFNAGVTLDAEAQGSYTVLVHVVDFFGAAPALDTTVTVTLNNMNDSTPVIPGGASITANVAENTTAVKNLGATDADNLGALSYSITGGADAGKFTINSAGDLSFNVAPDHEAQTDSGADNVYNVVVQVSDGVHTVTQAIAVTVTDANDTAPVITTSAAQSISENMGFSVPLAFTDADTVGAVSFSLTGGADMAQFSIVGGNLTMAAKDFEAQTDSGLDNTYVVQVTANDGVNSTNKLITVTVGDANDNAPVITTAAAQPVSENAAFSVLLTFTDADTVGAVSFSLTGGADMAQFSIVGGNLTMAAKDFEAQTDSGLDNTYVVQVTANDGVNSTNKLITVTVTNAEEPLLGTPGINPPDPNPAQRHVGDLVTAVTSGLLNDMTDADCASLTAPATSGGLCTTAACVLGYQWERSATSGGAGVVIPGATNSTYTLTDSDYDQYMSLCVSTGSGAACTHRCTANDATAVGDPHIFTVDGLRYDFQGAGEFVALRGAGGMEIQLRMEAVPTAPPLPDDYTGLTSGVSVNTAVAARVGKYRVSYQWDPASGTFVLRVEGKPVTPPAGGIDLGDGGRVLKLADGIQIDFPNRTTLMVNTSSWPFYGAQWLHINVFHTPAYDGLMGARSKGSWLPKLSDGSAFGAKPASLHDRYVQLYEKFADSWRVNKDTSLFDYVGDTSMAKYENKKWPTENGPYAAANVAVAQPLPRPAAELACRDIAGKVEKANCVFDVRVMGHKDLAKGHLLNQKIRLGAVNVVVRPAGKLNAKGEMVVTATVARHAMVVPKVKGVRAVPAGAVQFMLGDKPLGKPLKLDAKGQAKLVVTRQNMERFNVGKLAITAQYQPARDKANVFLPSVSRKLTRELVRGK